MLCRKLLTTVALLTITLAAMPVSAAPITDTLTLNYAVADSMVSAIEPFLESNERVAAYGNQLIIRAEPERIQQIRSLLKDLDRKPAQLRITVSNESNTSSDHSGYQVEGRIKTNEGDIIVGHPRGRNQARVIQRRTQGTNDGSQVIIANEGYPVLIQTGQRVPLTSISTNVYGQVIQQTDYHDVTAGFYATVRLSGDTANITISANNDRLAASPNKAIDVQRTETMVSGPLGEWITIGGLNDNARTQDKNIGRRTTTRRSDQMNVRVKIDRIN